MAVKQERIAVKREIVLLPPYICRGKWENGNLINAKRNIHFPLIVN